MTSAGTFGRKLDAFLEHQDAPWSRLMYAVAAANLRRHIGVEALDVLDAGGGTGLEAVALARQGHRVALVDYSKEMLDEARKRMEGDRIRERIEIHQGDVADLPRLFSPSRFDLALCHNVLQYVESPEAVLQAIRLVLKPRGWISVISVNRYSEPYRLALQERDLQAALTALDQRMIRSKVFEAPMRAFSAEEMTALLRKTGFRAAGEYGIRCFNDYIPDNDFKKDPQTSAEIERLELAMSDKLPYRLVARFFHLMAQKESE